MLLVSKILILLASGFLAVMAKNQADKAPVVNHKKVQAQTNSKVNEGAGSTASAAAEKGTEYLVIALAAVASALAALGGLLLDKAGPNSGTLLRMLYNLAFYAAAPMLVTALLALARNYPISRPAWGRWLLALIALYELLRRMSYGEQYTLILATVLVAGFALSLIWFQGRRLRLVMGLSAALFVAAVAAYAFATMTLALLVTGFAIASLGVGIGLVPNKPEA